MGGDDWNLQLPGDMENGLCRREFCGILRAVPETVSTEFHAERGKFQVERFRFTAEGAKLLRRPESELLLPSFRVELYPVHPRGGGSFQSPDKRQPVGVQQNSGFHRSHPFFKRFNFIIRFFKRFKLGRKRGFHQCYD